MCANYVTEAVCTKISISKTCVKRERCTKIKLCQIILLLLRNVYLYKKANCAHKLQESVAHLYVIYRKRSNCRFKLHGIGLQFPNIECFSTFTLSHYYKVFIKTAPNTVTGSSFKECGLILKSHCLTLTKHQNIHWPE